VGGGESGVLSYTAFGEPVWADANGEVQVGFAPLGFGTRYQYAGGWGYETGVALDWDALADPNVPWDPNAFVPPDDVLGLAGANPALPPIRLLHVGWRWYDPSLGRFVQRDQIGLDGGLNAYGYCGGDPLALVDPTGELSIAPPGGRRFWSGDTTVHDWVARNFWLRFHSPQYLESPWATAEAIGLSVAGGVVAYYGGRYAVRAGLRAMGSLVCVKIKVHGPHHRFPWLGKLPHVQINWWRPGIRGSGGVLRIPLFPGANRVIF